MIRTLPPENHEAVLWAHANTPSAVANIPGYGSWTWQQLMLDAVKAWKPYSNRVMVGCRDTQAEAFFEFFLPRVPSGMHVTGAIQAPMALKGWGMPSVNSTDIYDLYDARKWQMVASHVLAIAAWTGTNEVVIDMEGPLKPFHRGETSFPTGPRGAPPIPINWNPLREAIKPLADIGVNILWYFPGILEDTVKFPNRHNETIDLVELVASTIPNSSYMETRLARPHYRQQADHVRCAMELTSLLGMERVHTRTICTASGLNGNKPCYSPTTVQWVIDATRCGPVSIYPGMAELLPTAEAFGAMATGA